MTPGRNRVPRSPGRLDSLAKFSGPPASRPAVVFGKRTSTPFGRLGERSWGELGGDRGAATVLMAGVVAVALVLFVGLTTVTAAQLASARARSAADFAALAAAGADVRPGAGEPCSVAAELARRNGGRLQRCTALGASRYEVVVTVRSAVRGMGPAVARARAGPVGGGPS